MISQYVSVPEIYNSSATEENQLTTSHPLNSSIAHDIENTCTNEVPIISSNNLDEPAAQTENQIDLSEIPIEVECPKKWKDILAQTDPATVKEVDIYQCLIQHLKSPSDIPKKGRHEFNVLLYKLFGCERPHDPVFLYFLARQLC